MNMRRILLVEDDPCDARLALAALETIHLAGQVDVVNDGVQALDFLNTRGHFRHRPLEHPAVVLLDIKLPLLNGLEVLEQIRGNPALRFLPVVMLTSSCLERDVRHAYELGANAYVVKGIDFGLYSETLRGLGRFWMSTNCPLPDNAAKLS